MLKCVLDLQRVGESRGESAMDEVTHLHTQLVDASSQLTASRQDLEEQRKKLHHLAEQLKVNRKQCEDAEKRLGSIRNEIEAAKQISDSLSVKLAVAKQRTALYQAHLRGVDRVGELIMASFKRRSVALRRCAAMLIPQDYQDPQMQNLAQLAQLIKQKRREREVKRERRTLKLREEKQFLLRQKIAVSKEMAMLKRRAKFHLLPSQR